MEMHKVYLSTSGGKYRVISQGAPISADKSTREDALSVAARFRLEVSPRVWNGDAGRFEDQS